MSLQQSAMLLSPMWNAVDLIPIPLPDPQSTLQSTSSSVILLLSHSARNSSSSLLVYTASGFPSLKPNSTTPLLSLKNSGIGPHCLRFRRSKETGLRYRGEVRPNTKEFLSARLTILSLPTRRLPILFNAWKRSANSAFLELFLSFCEDGVDLLDLSMKYQVHVSFSSQPLALHVEGLIGHLKELSQHISKIKNVRWKCMQHDPALFVNKCHRRSSTRWWIYRLNALFDRNLPSEYQGLAARSYRRYHRERQAFLR